MKFPWNYRRKAGAVDLVNTYIFYFPDNIKLITDALANGKSINYEFKSIDIDTSLDTQSEVESIDVAIPRNGLRSQETIASPMSPVESSAGHLYSGCC